MTLYQLQIYKKKNCLCIFIDFFTLKEQLIVVLWIIVDKIQ